VKFVLIAFILPSVRSGYNSDIIDGIQYLYLLNYNKNPTHSDSKYSDTSANEDNSFQNHIR